MNGIIVIYIIISNSDNSKFSSESRVSRFGLTTDENGTTLRGNNSFLHDNVD